MEHQDPYLEAAAGRLERSLKPRPRLVKICAVLYGLVIVTFVLFFCPWGSGIERTGILLPGLLMAWYGGKKLWITHESITTIMSPVLVMLVPIIAFTAAVIPNSIAQDCGIREAQIVRGGVLAGKAGIPRPIWGEYIILPSASRESRHILPIEFSETKKGVKIVLIVVDKLTLRYKRGVKADRMEKIWGDLSPDQAWSKIEASVANQATVAIERCGCKPCVVSLKTHNCDRHGTEAEICIARIDSQQFRKLMHDPKYLNPALAKLGLEVDSNRTKE